MPLFARSLAQRITFNQIFNKIPSQLFTMFGQFVCHDILQTPSKTIAAPSCCVNETTRNDFDKCLPIIIPAGDPFFNASVNTDCLDFKRAVPFCPERGGDPDFVNGLTAYVDSGNVYGLDPAGAVGLRTNSSGQLKVTLPGNLLPLINSKFTAGEARAIENPALAVMHTLFLREHNRVANLISQVRGTSKNPLRIVRCH